MTTTIAPAPITHAAKKATRLTAEREKWQQKIENTKLEHAADLAILRQAIERETTTIRILELQRSERQEIITCCETAIAELERRLAAEREGLAIARAQLADREAALTDCAKALHAAQQAYDDRADTPKRQTAALEKKRDNADRRLRTHLAREPLPALFLGREKKP